MSVWAIGDLHLSLGGDKPMDVFGGWKDYVQRLEANWRSCVAAEDTVVVAGDISWAMRLEECDRDFAFLQSLPGEKLLLKGNHDYWWTTMAKMKSYLVEKGFSSLGFLFNNAFLREGLALCGTRSWLFETGEEPDAKVARREAGRLKMSLDDAARQNADVERVVFLHYPPVFMEAKAPEMLDLLGEYGVKRCYYGHLHGPAIRHAVEGRVAGVQYRLISADALSFEPLKIELA